MKAALFILFWSCILLHQRIIADAQCIPSVRYTVESGLAHSNVLRLTQDTKGYLWLGTQHGISRFDGEQFTTYTTAEGLQRNAVMSINELADGSLLIGSYRGGLDILRDGRIQPFPARNSIPASILYTEVDTRGRIWLITKGTERWECGYIQQEVYHPFPLYASAGGKRPLAVFRVRQMPDSTVLFGTDHGVFRLLANGRVEPAHPSITAPIYVLDQRDGRLWLGSDSRLYCVDLYSNKVRTVEIGEGAQINVLRATDNGIWCYARERGLYCVRGNSIVDYTSLLQLSTTIVNDLITDAEGNLWLGTYGHGAFCVSDFDRWNYTTEHGLTGSYVSAVAEDNTGRIWVGSMGGISVLENGHFRRFGRRVLRHDEIPNAILAVGDMCWVASTGRVVSLDRSGNIVFRGNLSGLSLCRTFTDVYIGNYLGYYSTSPVLRKVADYPALLYRRINAMLHEPPGTLWFATDSGVFRCEGAGLRHFTTGETYALCRDSSGAIWCATDKELCVYNGSWKVFTVADGLSHNRCSSVLCDRSGIIWAGTLRGVNRFDGSRFICYNAHQGLAADEVNTIFLDSRDHLWIGTVNGLTRFTLPPARGSSRRLPVYITEVNVNNRPVAMGPAANFAADEHAFHFQFKAVRLNGYRDVRYRYRLIGTDNIWQATQETSVRYSALSPGSYTFTVQAALAGEEWTQAEAAHYTFTIAPPFWRKWWFVAGCCLLLIVLAALLVRLRERRFKRLQAEKFSVYSRMLNLRQQALTALVNPHFVFNSLNSIQFFINRSNKELANEYLANFADLIRRTIEDSQSVVVSLRDELSRLELYLELESLRFANKFRYRISPDPKLDLEEVLIPVMLIQPYVENAIWHGIMPKGGRGEVHVAVWSIDSRLHIVVEDDGVGIESSKKVDRRSHHVSRGMQVMRERLELIGKMAGEPIVITVRELTDPNGEACGTRVEINIPLGLERLAATSTAPI